MRDVVAVALTVAGGLVSARCVATPPTEATDAATRPVEAMPLAEVRAEWPYLTVQLLEVTRLSSGVVEVRFSVRNTSTEGEVLEFGERFAADPADRDSVADVHLVDRTGAKKYFVVRTADGQPVCSRSLEPLGAGESRTLWVRLAAPPRDVTRVTVQVPHVPPFADVPVAAPGT